MKKRLVIFFVSLTIILCFLSHSLAQQRSQTKPIQVPSRQLEKAKIVELPDLIVDSIWLDNQCHVNFRLKNSGKGNIPDGEHRECAVRVQFGSEIKDFPMLRIDPSGVLKKAGGSVSFNTQVLLKSSVDVKVVVDFNRKIKEIDSGEKNNEKMAKLTPQCPSVAKAELKTKTLTAGGAEAQTSDVPPRKSKPPTVTPPGKGGLQDTAPLNITILSPTKNSSWNIGSNLNIQWKGILSPGNFHIFLKTPGMADKLPSGTGEPVAADIVSYKKMQPNQQGVFNYDWKIPSSIAPQDYIVKIIYADDPKVFTKSEVFKINKGGLSVITPKTLYSGPPVKGFGVEVPLSTNQWRAGEAANIIWQVLNTILGDQNSLDQMDEKVRIVLKDTSGAERLTIAQDVVNRKWVDWQNLKWTVPEGFPDGKYIVRVETPDGHFYGESLPFTIWNPKVVKVDKKMDKLAGGVRDEIIFKSKGAIPPVTATYKLLSMTPVLNWQTKRLDKIDLMAEIDASADFQLVGTPLPQDPMLMPVSLQPRFILILEHKLVSVQPTKIQTKNQTYDILANLPMMEKRVLEWQPGYCGMAPLACPTGVLKKGKNVVKFTIYVQSIPQTENIFHCNPSWWAPLTIKRHLEFNEYDRDTGKTIRVIIAVKQEFDLLIRVYLQIYGMGLPGGGPHSILETIVSEPRGSKYLTQGGGCINE